jgi:hypothetical protein
MERGLASQPTGPGALARVGERIAAANQLIQASRKAVAQATVQIQQSHDRLGRPDQRGHDSAGRARAAHRSAAAAGQRFLRAKQRSWPPTIEPSCATNRRPSSRSAWAIPTEPPTPAPTPSTCASYANRPCKNCATGKPGPQPAATRNQLPHRRDRFTLGGMRTATQAYSTATQRADGNAACRRGCGLPPGIR